MFTRGPTLSAFRRWQSRSFSGSASFRADYTHVVVGAGAVGLAIARRLAQRDGTSTLLIERHPTVGTETSSRNSEVIHAGLYYGPDTLKTALCIRGKRKLYDLCEKEGIPHRNTKKWILAQDDHQAGKLQKTHEFANSIGVPVQFLPLSQVRDREPAVRAEKAVLESPTTGIVDSHAYMAFLQEDFMTNGGDLACSTALESIESLDAGRGGWKLNVKSGSEQVTSIVSAETIINSAGLAAVELSNQILPASRSLKPYFAKGSYYSYNAAYPKPQTLLYPAPMEGAAGLGTHLTMDMAGQIRFGPDVEWVDDPHDLAVNSKGLSAAIEAIKTYLPGIHEDKIQLDYCGIRPKLAKGGAVGKGKGFADFIIRKEDGFEGFVNLLGIESPGLTSSLAIGDYVHDLLHK